MKLTKLSRTGRIAAFAALVILQVAVPAYLILRQQRIENQGVPYEMACQIGSNYASASIPYLRLNYPYFSAAHDEELFTEQRVYLQQIKPRVETRGAGFQLSEKRPQTNDYLIVTVIDRQPDGYYRLQPVPGMRYYYPHNEEERQRLENWAISQETWARLRFHQGKAVVDTLYSK